MIELIQYCPVCSAPMEWVDCDSCQDGYINLYEKDPMWYDEADTEACEICMGRSGWQVCTNFKSHPVTISSEGAK